jgi:exoribonuclease-2
MERYWAQRWIRQEDIRRIGATVVRGDVLRLEGLPYVTRLPGLPELPRGQRLELDVLGADDIDLTLEARVHRVLTEQAEDVDDAEDAEVAEVAVPAELGNGANAEQAAPGGAGAGPLPDSGARE